MGGREVAHTPVDPRGRALQAAESARVLLEVLFVVDDVNVRARIRVGVLGLVIGGSVACARGMSADADGSTVGGVRPVGTVAPAAGEGMKGSEREPSREDSAGAELDENDSAVPMSEEVEWVESPARVDLDGDGKPESITWSCGGRLRLTVGGSRVSEPYQVVEEMGCDAGVVMLRLGEVARQIVIVIDEHEEVGPDLHFIYAYREGKLEQVWSDKAKVVFLVDGSWMTEITDCYEGAGYLATLTGRHRFDGNAVTSEVDEVRTPVEPGDCAEP